MCRYVGRLYLIAFVQSAPQLRCSVLLQKETVDGLKDEACGKDAMEGCAGLCRYLSLHMSGSKLMYASLVSTI